MYSPLILYLCIPAVIFQGLVDSANVTHVDVFPADHHDFDFDVPLNEASGIEDNCTSDIDDMYFRLSGSSGVPAMHAALVPPEGMVLFLDKIETWTLLKLPNGRFAYSSLYDPTKKVTRPVSVTTNPFCCGGSFLADGRLVTVGGNGPLPWVNDSIKNGFDAIRWYSTEGGDDS
jgi:hypothetical protein